MTETNEKSPKIRELPQLKQEYPPNTEQELIVVANANEMMRQVIQSLIRKYGGSVLTMPDSMGTGTLKRHHTS